MGVEGLLSWIERQSFNYKLDFIFDDECKGKALIVDANSIVEILYQDWTVNNSNGKLEKISDNLRKKIFKLISGGNHLENLNVWSNVIRKFDEKNVKLVFYFDGGCSTTNQDEINLQKWISKQYYKIKFLKKLFYYLKGESDLLEDKSSMCTLRAPPLQMHEILKHHFGKEVYFSKKAADREIIAKAIELNAIGILSSDTDFMVYDYPEKINFLSITDFDFENMKTKRFDREIIRKQLGLKIKEMPILAGWMKINPNRKDVIESIEAKSKAIVKIRNEGGFNISTNISKIDTENSDNDISVEIEKTNLVNNFINEYNTKLLELTLQQKNFWMMSVMKYQFYKDGVEYVIDKSDRVLYGADIYKKLRSRLYGVMLNEKFGAFKVTELFVQRQSEVKKDQVKIQRPEFEIPSILKFHEKNFNKEIRIKLFAWVVDPRINAGTFKGIDMRHWFILSQIHSIQTFNTNYKILKDWEIDVFFVTHLLVLNRLEEKNLKPICSFKYRRPLARGVELASLFTKDYVLNLAHLLGFAEDELKHFWILRNFDGEIFQNLYYCCDQKKKNLKKTIDEFHLQEALNSLNKDYQKISNFENENFQNINDKQLIKKNEEYNTKNKFNCLSDDCSD